MQAETRERRPCQCSDLYLTPNVQRSMWMMRCSLVPMPRDLLLSSAIRCPTALVHLSSISFVSSRHPPVLEAEQKPVYAPPGTRSLHPAEQLARSRRPALIEYCASGIYVIISSQEGEMHLEPNSRAWFDWLATLSSFRFIGPVGRFTAHRGYKQGQQTHFWSASRCVRRHTYKHYLGVTESLTLASLEHVAARLQSDINAR